MSSLTTDPLRVSTNGSGPTDVEFLTNLRWSSGPDDLIAAASRSDAAAFTREVRRDLARRFGRKPPKPERLAARFPSQSAEARAVYQRFLGETASSASRPGTTSALIRTVALFDGLRRFGGSIAPNLLWPLWRESWLAAESVAQSPDTESPLDRMLAAEVRWAAGLLFEGTAVARAHKKAGRARLLAEFEAGTDTDGTPHAALLPLLADWFASLARIVAWAKAADTRLWPGAWSGRFDGLLRTIATLTAPDGRLLLTGSGDLRPILREAVKRSGWGAGSPVRRLISKFEEGDAVPAVPSNAAAPKKVDRKSPPVVQSDWGKLALARARWRPDADAFAITFDRELPAIEFVAAGRPVFAGEWGLRIRLDGRELTPTAGWESVSWFSDSDADYLELQWTNEEALVVCRQFLLSRRDHQLVVADCVSLPSRPDARIEVESLLSLAPDVTAATRRPSRELRIDASGLPIRAFPVALPPERIENVPGAFEPEGGRLAHRRSGPGGVYLPVVFDWHPGRREAPPDWRTLTVTEDRERLGPARASGHRLRVGDQQLLIYRGLDGSKHKRTVLGHHHAYESVIARFTKTGDVEPLVLVE